MTQPTESNRDSSATMRPWRSVGGFSLVELLVVIAIIGVLISLLLPAVQAARESARRVHCMNNLKQLALAVQNYESTKKTLPPCGLVEDIKKTYGSREYRVFDQMSGHMIGWAVLVLPYLEQGNLYDQFDISKSILEQDGQPQQTFVETYLCPSDAARGNFFVDQEYTSGRSFAKGNYAAFVGPYHTDLQLVYPGALIAKEQPLREVSDGMSSTILFGEVRTNDIANDERGAWALPWNGSSLLAFDMHHDKSAGGYFSEYMPWNAPFVVEQVQLPNFLGPNSDMLVRCADESLAQLELERMPCDRWAGNLGLFGYSSAAPRSLHPGGVNSTYLDGHVEFLPNDIDPFVMTFLIDVKGSEAVSLAQD